MNNTFQQKAGIALLIFVVLLVFTMVLHPIGGNIERIIKITGVIVTIHAIAIFSLPFGCIGCWGITRRLGHTHFLPLLGFIMATFGLLTALLAATANGLVLPLFLQHYKDAEPAVLESIRPVVRYSFALNLAFDYIYTCAFSLAILCWSGTIIRQRSWPAWIGWLGIVIIVAVTITLACGIAVNSLKGLRYFVTAIVIWLLLVGVRLYREKGNGE
ncbi:MAG: hypothetical protein QM731_25030 [Chitinophagaceae bacterium]